MEEGGEDHDKNNSGNVTAKQQTKDEVIPICSSFVMLLPINKQKTKLF